MFEKLEDLENLFHPLGVVSVIRGCQTIWKKKTKTFWQIFSLRSDLEECGLITSWREKNLQRATKISSCHGC